jgi:dihydrofolate synthase/folylpolyglutamate synthase
MTNNKVMTSLTAERPLAAKSTSSDALLDRLTGLHPKLIDLSLGRIERLLDRLDHPERALPPVVHVAGTNGKGSVIAYLAAMLRAEGCAVHSYISPHLVRFHERICLDGQPIAEPDLVRLLQVCEAANGEAPITFFEITTAAAFLAFSRVPAEVLLLETGLGGRLDATNVVARPRLTVITPLSLDHTQYLGETLEEIAFEKAGILKPGVTAVVAPQEPRAFQVIARRAEELGAPLICGGRDWSVEPTSDGFLFRGTTGARRFPLPGLTGPHQVDNAALALAAAEALDGLKPSESSLRRGLLEAEWPGRLQRLKRGPLVDLMDRVNSTVPWELWLDGGHNGAAGEALSRALADWQDRPLHLVFGMMSSKAVQDFLGPLAPLAETLRAVSIPGEHATLSAHEAADKAREAGLEAQTSSSVADALEAILDTSDRPGRVLICGSLYLAGSVLADNG